MWFDEVEGKRELTLGVLTVLVRMFPCTALSEVYSIISTQRFLVLLIIIFPANPKPCRHCGRTSFENRHS